MRAMKSPQLEHLMCGTKLSHNHPVSDGVTVRPDAHALALLCANNYNCRILPPSLNRLMPANDVYSHKLCLLPCYLSPFQDVFLYAHDIHRDRSV